MKKPLANSYNRLITPEEQRLYQHWTEQVSLREPIELIEQFRLLFIVGSGYPDRQATQILERILASKLVQEDFIFILNRCCYIVLNSWGTLPNRRNLVDQFIQLFEGIDTARYTSHYPSRRQKKLFELVQGFVRSDQYIALRRFAEVLCQNSLGTNTSQSQPLGKLIARYPYLYRHCLVSPDSSYDHRQMIYQIQVQKQRKFELDLSQYAAHQWRRAEVAKVSLEAAKQIKSPVTNPTLLSNRELIFALRQFAGKVEGSYTYQDMAKRFVKQTSFDQTFRSFKNELYEYLVPDTFSSSYAQHQFGNKFYRQLQGIVPHNNDESVSESLILRTCGQVLSFLVIESPQKPNHFIFVDLIANIGPTLTVGLLLKVVLICRKARPYLEKRFSILFDHYETSSQDRVHWLVRVLENLNVALTANFGKVDLSFIS